MSLHKPLLRDLFEKLFETINQPMIIILGLLYSSVAVMMVPDDRSLSLVGLSFKFLLIYIYVQPLVWVVSYAQRHSDQLRETAHNIIVKLAFSISIIQYLLWIFAGWIVAVENYIWPAVAVISGLFLIYCTILLFKAGRALCVFWAFSVIISVEAFWYITEWQNGVFGLGFNVQTFGRVLPVTLTFVAAYFTYREIKKSDRFD